MGEAWSILLVLLGVGAVVAGVMLATGNKPWKSNDVRPTSPPAGPGAEGERVVGPGGIAPGPANDQTEAT
jgi:hypothetical protein